MLQANTPGSIPEKEDGTNNIYNTLTAYNPEGQMVAKHRKVHLFDIDIPGRMLNVRLSDAELAEHRQSWTRPEPRYKTGYLAKYTAMATSAASGAVLKWS